MTNKRDLKRMYGSTPESFKRRVSSALTETEETPAKRFALRTAVLCAALLLLLTTVGFAAFSPQAPAFFGRIFGTGMEQRLSEGRVAAPETAFTTEGVTFTLEKVVYRDHALYAIGTIRTAEDSGLVLLPEGYDPETMHYGYNEAGGSFNTSWADHQYPSATATDVGASVREAAPPEALTFAETAQARGARLTEVSIRATAVSVDGGSPLSSFTTGNLTDYMPQRDGSLRFSFILQDAYAIEEGERYTVELTCGLSAMTDAGVFENVHRSVWTAELEPTVPECATQTVSNAQTSAPTAAPALMDDVTVLTPEEYDRTGTLPIFRAEARNFGAVVEPELFSQSAITGRDDHNIDFADGGVLTWSEGGVLYGEYLNVTENEDGTPDLDVTLQPARSGIIFGLASAATEGLFGEVPQRRSDALENLTLAQARSQLETLPAALDVTGYTCAYALDMDQARIRDLGEQNNAQVQAGRLGSNCCLADYSTLTAEDEGWYLFCTPLLSGIDARSRQGFYAEAYVTSRGIVHFRISEPYRRGAVYDTPQALVSPEHIAARLVQDMLDAGTGNASVAAVRRVCLTYAPMRAANKADGMVLSPIWLVLYDEGENAPPSGSAMRAEYDAVTGELLNAAFKTPY